MKRILIYARVRLADARADGERCVPFDLGEHAEYPRQRMVHVLDHRDVHRARRSDAGRQLFPGRRELVPGVAAGDDDAHVLGVEQRGHRPEDGQRAHRLGCADGHGGSPTRAADQAGWYNAPVASERRRDRSESGLRSRELLGRNVLRARQQLGHGDDHVHRQRRQQQQRRQAPRSSTTTPARTINGSSLRPCSGRERLVQPPGRGELHCDRQPLRGRRLLGGDVLRPRRRLGVRSRQLHRRRRQPGQRRRDDQVRLDRSERERLARARPDSNGWYNRPVAVSFGGADNASGLAGCSAGVTYSGPDGMGSASGSCNDVAGNTGSGAVQIPYDATAPTVKDLVTARPRRCCGLVQPSGRRDVHR